MQPLQKRAADFHFKISDSATILCKILGEPRGDTEISGQAECALLKL
jgi:hypothetical protein